MSKEINNNLRKLDDAYRKDMDKIKVGANNKLKIENDKTENI